MPIQPPYLEIDPAYQSLIDDYIRDTLEKLAHLEQLILATRAQAECLPIKRIAHNIKGSAGTYGFFIVSQIFQRLEDSIELLDKRQESRWSELTVSKLLYFVDSARPIFERVAAGNNQIDDLIPGLKKGLADVRLTSDLRPRTTSVLPTRILINDQTEMIRHILADRLQADHYSIEYRNDIAEAAHTLKEFRPQVLITSYHLDGFYSGVGLCALAKLAFDNPLPVTILLTTVVKEQIKERQFCDHIFRKDLVTYDDILRIIRETRYRKA